MVIIVLVLVPTVTVLQMMITKPVITQKQLYEAEMKMASLGKYQVGK